MKLPPVEPSLLHTPPVGAEVPGVELTCFSHLRQQEAACGCGVNTKGLWVWQQPSAGDTVEMGKGQPCSEDAEV